jgi:hypothetical protein
LRVAQDYGEGVFQTRIHGRGGFPQPTGEFEELAADSLVLALGQDTDLSLINSVPGIA